MNAVPFDTLKLARRLRAIGFPEAQADGMADAMADVMTGSDLATKADIGDLRSEMALLRTEVKADVAAVDQRLAKFRMELKGDNEVLRRDLTIRLGSMIVVAVGVLLTGMRLMQLHP